MSVTIRFCGPDYSDAQPHDAPAEFDITADGLDLDYGALTLSDHDAGLNPTIAVQSGYNIDNEAGETIDVQGWEIKPDEDMPSRYLGQIPRAAYRAVYARVIVWEA